MGSGRESHSFCVYVQCPVCVCVGVVRQDESEIKEGEVGGAGGVHRLNPPLLTREQRERRCGVVNGKLNGLINNLALVRRAKDTFKRQTRQPNSNYTGGVGALIRSHPAYPSSHAVSSSLHVERVQGCFPNTSGRLSRGCFGVLQQQSDNQTAC